MYKRTYDLNVISFDLERKKIIIPSFYVKNFNVLTTFGIDVVADSNYKEFVLTQVSPEPTIYTKSIGKESTILSNKKIKSLCERMYFHYKRPIMEMRILSLGDILDVNVLRFKNAEELIVKKRGTVIETKFN